MAARESLAQAILRRLPLRHVLAGALGRVRGGRVRAVVNGAVMWLDLREGIQQAMFLLDYEPVQTQWFRECLAPGDVAIDVGASFGYYATLAAALVGPAGKVFAFEPSPVASSVLEAAIADSGLAHVVLTKAAAGERAGSLPLYLPDTGELHSPSLLSSDPAFAPVQVPVVALDAFEALRAVPRVKLVKIDVEGYEPNVLEGMREMIRAGRVENVVCEFNSWWLERNGTTPARLCARFAELGFHVRKSTELRTGLPGRHGATFDLQDLWLARA